jgi:hypothetical protein
VASFTVIHVQGEVIDAERRYANSAPPLVNFL